MRNLTLLGVTAVAMLSPALLGWAGQGGGKKFNFKGALVGQLPKGWIVARTGKGSGGDWKIVEDKGAPKGLALAQTKADKGATFNLCVAEDSSFQDLDLSVAFKPVAGDVDQGGGLVWRFKDGDNYYVARMNPLEENFRLYKVVGGQRMQLASALAKGEEGKWHSLRIVHKGSDIECYFNGKKYLHAKDDTFSEAGRIGVWTKADAQTRFAKVEVKAP
jgi:hypothetical protein